MWYNRVQNINIGINYFLKLELVEDKLELSIEEKLKYCGTYKEFNGELDCKVTLDSDDLVCDVIWKDIRLLPLDINNKFLLESFPVLVRFTAKNGVINELSLSGNRKKLDGKNIKIDKYSLKCRFDTKPFI